MAEQREGPLRIVTYRCSGCVFHSSEHYAVQSDWGYDHYCRHPSQEQPKLLPRRIGYDDNTPSWCPFRAASSGRSGREEKRE